MSVLRIENLDKKYKKKGREIFALKGVDLDIEEGVNSWQLLVNLGLENRL